MSRPIGTMTFKPEPTTAEHIKAICGPNKHWSRSADFVLEAVKEKLETDPRAAENDES